MASSSSYTPNESNNTIIREELWFQGTLLSNFFFGIQTTLCFLAIIAVLRQRTPKHSRMRIALLAYTTVLFALTTAAQGLTLQWIQMGFITQRNYPGGPDAFLSNEWSIPVNLAPNILIVFANWMMESLLVWRCHVVCSTGERPWLFGVAIPLLSLIGVFVIGSLLVHRAIQTTPTITYVLAYGICSLTLNLVATGFIAGRLLVHRHRVVGQLGRAHGHYYADIVMVLVESAGVYTGFLIVLIVTYAVKSPVSIILQQVIVQVQTITSFFIIWQIARKKGFTASADTDATTMTVSSLIMRVEPASQTTVIQLEVLSTQQDEAEEASTQPTENENKVSLHKHGEV